MGESEKLRDVAAANDDIDDDRGNSLGIGNR